MKLNLIKLKWIWCVLIISRIKILVFENYRYILIILRIYWKDFVFKCYFRRGYLK